jgi:hypothetical protein
MSNQLKKANTMKLVKLGVFALAFGLFAASCGNDNSTSTETTTDSSAMAPAPAVEPAPAAAPAMDSTSMNAAPEAGADTAHMQTK